MYVINQKSTLFPNNLPNGSMYFPDNQMHPGNHIHTDQLAFPTYAPTSMINSHIHMQSNMTRFINPSNGNPIKQTPIRTSPMMNIGNKNNNKAIMNGCSLTDDSSLPFLTGDNFPSMNSPYKSRIPSLDSGQSINHSQNNNLYVDLIKPINMPSDSCMSMQATTGSRVQTQRNKRTRTSISRSQTPNIQESINSSQMAIATTNVNNIRSSSVNMMPGVGTGIQQPKCLTPIIPNGNMALSYSGPELLPQQMRPRIAANVMNPYGCSRPQIMDKNLPMFQPSSLSTPAFSPSPQTTPPYMTQIDSVFPLPMFHLHSKLLKLPESDRLIFPVNHGNLWGPLTLKHGDKVTEVQFELNQDNLQQIVNRCDLDIVVTSFTHRDQFRLCHWPEFLELKINGNLLTLDTTVIQDLKAHTTCCIKKFCRHGTNTLQFTVSKCVCCHLFQIYMVHRPTLSHAIETITNKCTTPTSTKTLLSEIYARSQVPINTNTDDNNNMCVISLICPMSQVRITIPARTKCCKHVQPFDLLEFLRVQTKWPQYFCPICRVRITFNLNEFMDNIVVDEIIKGVITQADSSVRRIILFPDGNWKSLNDVKSDCQVPRITHNLQDHVDIDPANQIFRQSPASTRSAMSSPRSIMSQKSNLYTDFNGDKKSNNTAYPPGILSPKLSHSKQCNDHHNQSLSNGLKLSPLKRTRKSPSNHTSSGIHNEPENNDINSPESKKTSLSPDMCLSSQGSMPATNNNPVIGNCVPINNVSPTRPKGVPVIPETEVNVTSSTNNFGHNSRSASGNNINKQTSSGSSDPSTPPEFFDPHSSTTNYEDEDSSSLHLQRLIGFIDEILSEEEEYVLDTQWASFHWPSADKALDLLHLSDIEKLL